MQSEDEKGKTSAERATSTEAPAREGGDGETLEDVARDEQDYVRERLRDELGHEPSDEETAEWQREHTEGY
ncbi:MAG: hypothetical protein WCD76_08145 [Pyrinomonadaceae bacterium]